jgi:hypothetical protein
MRSFNLSLVLLSRSSTSKKSVHVIFAIQNMHCWVEGGKLSSLSCSIHFGILRGICTLRLHRL